MKAETGFVGWLVEECGYTDVRELPGGRRYAAIMPLGFTHAIITGRIGDMIGIDDRWCYHDKQSAKAALDAWDGTGEPMGWHRHPASGRRVAQEDGEYDGLGAQHSKGDLLVRG
jgi:hypothetical protein